MKDIKQVIVVRNDLKMRKGKLASQVAHASLACILNKLRGVVKNDPYLEEKFTACTFLFEEQEYIWLRETDDSKFTKIVLKVESEEELLEIYNKAKEKGLNCSLIKDAGNTFFKEPTYTTLGIGPDYSEILEEITGHLKLL
jgi:peptidyl-tRNA hydrolase, PTH2 family